MEMVCPGRLVGAGKRAPAKSCDYVLMYRGRKLATVEAKAATKGYTDGRTQALDYAERLGTRFAYSTNGLQWREYDRKAQTERDIAPDDLPTPDELWARTYPQEKLESPERIWRRRFGAVPFASDGGKWQPRYYQHRAITAVTDAVAAGCKRILLTLATGTGKTGVAYQVAWKLSEARWTLDRADDPHGPPRRPRILFLADRNILADQAYNSFGGFSDTARIRLTPKLVAKSGGQVPTHASVYFSIFQTLLSGGADVSEEESEDADVVMASPDSRYLQYPTDFFDLIVIDECHRAGARDQTPWRDILNYFEPAVQLGLTATPRRDENADSYDYFGEPVYSYALREGIEDGFLTPFKVQRMTSTIEEFVFRPSAGHTLVSGMAEDGDVFTAAQQGRTVVLPEVELATVKELLSRTRPMEKTLVFCHTQEHAARIRDLINELSPVRDHDYCVRVTADDGEAGEAALRRFQDTEKTIPVVLTTSRKLSTGVDARDVRNIVLMRPITSMIEFKQIVGRGTRVHDGKDYFTIYDFVRAYEHFNDPDWDGEPEAPSLPPTSQEPGDDEGDEDPPLPPGPDEPLPERTVITLAPGEAREIAFASKTDYWLEGRPVSAEVFLRALFGEIGDLVSDESELRRQWGDPDLRASLLEQLEARGFAPDTLADMAHVVNAADSDLFDVLAFVKFSLEPQTRMQRAARVRADTLSALPSEMRDFLRDVLEAYEANGVKELSKANLRNLLHVRYHGTQQAVAALGPAPHILKQFADMQSALYAQ